MTNEDVAVRLAEDAKEIGSLKHRMDDVEKNQSEQMQLVRSVDKLASTMDQMVQEQKKQGARLDRLEAEPGQNWRTFRQTVISTIISVTVGGLIGALLALIFK